MKRFLFCAGGACLLMLLGLYFFLPIVHSPTYFVVAFGGGSVAYLASFSFLDPDGVLNYFQKKVLGQKPGPVGVAYAAFFSLLLWECYSIDVHSFYILCTSMLLVGTLVWYTAGKIQKCQECLIRGALVVLQVTRFVTKTFMTLIFN